jgi:hypothetical protein
MRFLLILTVLTVGLMTGFAEDTGAYQVIGAGAVSCGTWTKERSDPQAHSLASIDVNWVLGFLSGIGYAGVGGDNPLRGMDNEGVSGWIDNYCRAHPIDHISGAAAAFYEAHPR